MAFPSSPSNGQRATVNDIIYEYNSTKGAWLRVSAQGFTSANLTVGGIITDNYYRADGTSLLGVNKSVYNGTAQVTTSVTLVDSVPVSGNTSVNWTLTSKDADNTTYKNSIVSSLNDGANVYYSEYGIILSNASVSVSTFTSNIVSGNLRLYATGDSANVTITFQRTLLGTSTDVGYLTAGSRGAQGPTGNVSYGNTEVAAYLTDYTGNIGNLKTTGNVITTGYFIGNGSQLTGIVTGSSYGNTEVAAYLLGNITTGNIIVNTATTSSSTTTGALRVAGGIGVAGTVYTKYLTVEGDDGVDSAEIKANLVLSTYGSAIKIQPAYPRNAQLIVGSITHNTNPSITLGNPLSSGGRPTSSTINFNTGLGGTPAYIQYTNSSGVWNFAHNSLNGEINFSTYSSVDDGTKLSISGTQGNVQIYSNAQSTSTSTGALVVAGGVGVGGNVNAGYFLGNLISSNVYSASSGNVNLNLYSSGTGQTYVRQSTGGAYGLNLAQDIVTSGSSARIYFLSSSGHTAIYNSGGTLFFNTASSPGTSSGFPQVKIAPTGTAVNWLQLTGSATGNAVPITVDGTDSNINLTLLAKGSGNITTANSVVISNTSASTSTTSGALRVSGGIGIAGNLNVGGEINTSKTVTALNILNPFLLAGM